MLGGVQWERRVSRVEKELGHIARNLSSELYSFTVRHHSACPRCKRSKGGRCKTMLALGMLDHYLSVDMKRGTRK